MIGTLHGPWLLIAAALLLTIAIRRNGRGGAAGLAPAAMQSDVRVVAVLAVLAVAARLGLGLWGPLHVNGQGPLWIRGALDATALAGYGPGYAELFGWAALFGTAADRAIFAANAILSGLSASVLYATARLLGVASNGALAAALVLAADPVLVRTAASESYFAPIIMLVLAVQLALAVGVRAHGRGNPLARNLAFVAAGCLAASAARMHPMSYLPLALCPLVVLGSAVPVGGWARLRLAALAALVIAAVVLLTSAATVVTALRASPMTGQAFTGVTQANGLPVLGLLAAMLLVHRWLTPRWLFLLALGSLAALLATRSAFQQSPLWHLSYQRVYFAGILLGAAPLLPRRAGLPGGIAGAGAVALLLFSVARPHVTARTTEQLEYRFLQDALAAMPPRCTLAAVNQAAMRIWEIPSYLVPQSSGQRTVTAATDLGAAPAACLLYVRSSLCASAEARPVCEAIERNVALEPLARRVFPPLPSYVGLPYDRDEVEVAIFRVKEHTVGVSDGAAITPEFARRLYDRVKTIRAPDGCAVTRLDTSRFRITIGVQPPAGTEHAVEVATAAGRTGNARGGGWNLVVSDPGRRDCGGTVAALEQALRELGDPRSAD